MPIDLLTRLRRDAPPFGMEEYDPTFDVRQEAADELARLRGLVAERDETIATLRNALKDTASRAYAVLARTEHGRNTRR